MSALTVPDTHYVSVGDMDVAYQVLGNGPIDLVYHHGSCHLELQWKVPQEAAWNRSLASFCRLIDRGGTGASERTSRGFVPTWEEWSEDVRAVLDEVGSESAAIFQRRPTSSPRRMPVRAASRNIASLRLPIERRNIVSSSGVHTAISDRLPGRRSTTGGC
jgi:hypothetical protein